MMWQKARKPIPKWMKTASQAVYGLSFFLFLYRVFYWNGDWFRAFANALNLTVTTIFLMKAFDDHRKKARKP